MILHIARREHARHARRGGIAFEPGLDRDVAAAHGELAFGTVDSWLLWKLTGGQVHATDVSNASRTMLFDIRRNAWDPALLALLHVPDSVLPKVHPSSHRFGEADPALLGAAIPIAAYGGAQARIPSESVISVMISCSAALRPARSA